MPSMALNTGSTTSGYCKQHKYNNVDRSTERIHLSKFVLYCGDHSRRIPLDFGVDENHLQVRYAAIAAALGRGYTAVHLLFEMLNLGAGFEAGHAACKRRVPFRDAHQQRLRLCCYMLQRRGGRSKHSGISVFHIERYVIIRELCWTHEFGGTEHTARNAC